jgi:transposase
VSEKDQDQLDLQALHRVRARLVSRRTATINQIWAFLIEQGITVRSGLRALKNSFETILAHHGLSSGKRKRTWSGGSPSGSCRRVCLEKWGVSD